MMLVLVVENSCTVVRDTTPCNNSRLLDLREKEELTQEEQFTRDSLERLCYNYQMTQSEGDAPQQDETLPNWAKVTIIAVGVLLTLFLSGLFTL